MTENLDYWEGQYREQVVRANELAVKLAAANALLNVAEELLTVYAARADFYDQALKSTLEVNNKLKMGPLFVCPPRDQANEEARSLLEKIKQYGEGK